MTSSQIQTGDETAVGESAESINTVTIDNVFAASAYGDFEKLRKFVEQDGASLSLPDNNGCYPLHIAAMKNFPEIAQYIIEHGGDVNAVGDKFQETALHWAAKEGCISVADVLLQNGAQLEAADVDGCRAVHIAARFGQTSFLNHIVAKHNADFDVPDNDGESPLHWAAYYGFVDTVKWLLSRDASQKRQDKKGRTPLHLAVIKGNLEVCTILIDAGTKQEIMVKDNRGNTPIQLATAPFVEQDGASLSLPDNDGDYALHLAAMNNFPEIAQYIIEHGGDVNAVGDKFQETALHWAAMRGSISVADVLLQNGAQVEAADVDGCRAVHIAARFGQTSFLNHIVAKHNADFDVPDNDGKSPLHWAAYYGFVGTVKWLLSRDASQKRQDKKGYTPLHLAVMKGNLEVCTILVDVGTKQEIMVKDNRGNTPIQLATTPFVEQDGASLSLPDNDGYYALHKAAFNNFPEIVQYIIEHGGDVNVVDDKFQQTALHWAAMRGSISVADVLMQNGAQVEAADVYGRRAVHIAARFGQTSFLNHIVAKHNADFDVPDNDGKSPLHWAAYYGFVDTVKWLLSRDASQKRQDKKGYTPLHLAVIKGNLEVSTVLIDAGTKQEMMLIIQLASAISQSARALLLSKVLQAECKHLQNSNFKGKALQKGTNWPMIIAMQGDAYTGKSVLAKALARRLKCPIISLDDFLDASEPTDEQDTLILHAFNVIAQMVKTQISLGLSVVVDSPLSRRSHLQKLVALISTENPHNTQLLIIECKPENEYAFQLMFEDSGSVIYDSSWYRPKGNWPLPKVPRDYTDEDIPHGVSKLVVDTTDCSSACKMLEAMFDVTSCGYGHITKYDVLWQFIHMDKEEQFTCPCCATSEVTGTCCDNNLHPLTFYEAIDHDDKLCGVCDNQVLGSCYTCQDCPLALHESCAELARDGKKHFVPESFPSFTPSEPHMTYAFPVERPCAECKKDGNGFSCKCNPCLFESHLKSRLVPTVVRHKVHNHFLTLWLRSNVGGSTHKYWCSACKTHGHFAMYFSYERHFYHPECALLPPLVHHTHGGYTHDLEMITRRVEKEEDYLCDCCSTKMDPTAWYYYCSKCPVSVHLECAFLDFDSEGSIVEA